MRTCLQSYEGFHVGCMYNEPMRLFLDSDERRFGGFGRLAPRTQHPATEAKDRRPHSVRIYLPSSTCAVYVRESVYCEKQPFIVATSVGPISRYPLFLACHLFTSLCSCASSTAPGLRLRQPAATAAPSLSLLDVIAERRYFKWIWRRTLTTAKWMEV